MPNTRTAVCNRTSSYASSDEEDAPLLSQTTADAMSPSLRYSYGSPSLGKRIKIKQRRHYISPRLRWMTNISALVCVFMFSGIIFGWAPFKLILQAEGQYAGLCGNDAPCVAQTVRFNRIFTAAQFFLSFASLPVGAFLDYASKTTHYVVAACCEIAGLVLLATADYSDPNLTVDDLSWCDALVVGYTLLALGGGMAMMGSFPASFLLPQYQGGILAAVSCLFDASSVVFAVFAPLNHAYPTTLSRRNLFAAYAVLAAVVFGVLASCWAMLERYDWKVVVEKEASDDNNYGATSNSGGDDTASSVASDNTTIDFHARRIQALRLHDWSLGQQLKTLDFAVVLTFASVHMLRCNFYIETVNEMLLAVAAPNNEATAVRYAQIFSFVLPLGVLFVPLIDGTVRAVGVVNTLHLTNGIGIVFGTLLLVPNLAVQGINFVVFTGFRAYLYATLNTYIAVTFGVSTMGRIIGCAFTTAAVVTLLQYPAATLAEDVFDGDFLVTNIIFLAVGAVVPVSLAMYYDRAAKATTINNINA